MARQPTGQVVEDPRRPGVYGLRFRAYGKRRYQGLGKISLGEAEAELRHLLADIERGIWQAPTSPTPAPAPTEVPTFHEFSSEWFVAHKGEWRPSTQLDYEWQLSRHLLPFFAGYRLSEISIREVDRYRALKVSEGVLSPATINKTITRLGQILEVAVEWELIPKNAARGKGRRVKVAKGRRYGSTGPSTSPRCWTRRASSTAKRRTGAGTWRAE